MAEPARILVHTTGNPSGGMGDDPWPSGQPSVGTRVAIFAYEVTSVDGSAENLRSYHVTPVDRVESGPVTPDLAQPQGITVRWAGCGAGTVVGPVREELAGRRCEVEPDDPRLADA